MNWVDIVVIAIIVLTSIIGLCKGLFESLLSLIGTGLSVFLAVLASKPVAKFLNKVIKLDDIFIKLLSKNNETGVLTIFGKEFAIDKVAAFCSIIVAIIVVWILIKVAIWLLSKLFDSATSNHTALSGMNRILGLLFGLVKGAVIVLACLSLVFCAKVLPFVGDKLDAPIRESSFTSKIYVHVGEFIGDKLEDRIDGIISGLVGETVKGEDPTEKTPETPETPETPGTPETPEGSGGSETPTPTPSE